MTKGEKSRENYLTQLMIFLEKQNEEVLRIATNSFCFPVTEDGAELFVRVKVEIPKGSKNEPFDGYELAEEYKELAEERKQRAKAKEEKNNGKN
jgi:hypothetical protein